jgi:hypothetical protein
LYTVIWQIANGSGKHLICYVRLVSFVIDMREHIGALLACAGSISSGLTPSGGAAQSKFMKRTFALILAALATVALFGALVQAVLVAAHVSEPVATTVYGLTSRRLWATTVAVLALVGVLIGGLALNRPANRFGTASGRLGAIVAFATGLIAAVNGALVLAIANGGLGSGNGVVGGAGALVLGLIALALGALALARSRRRG